MRRREFIALMGASVAWPFAAMAQQAGRTYRLGCLLLAPRDAPIVVAFFDELRRHGFIEGQNLTVEYRLQHLDLNSRYAAELVEARVDVIATAGDETARAVQQATKTIPIVASVGDMLGSGLVTSLARPEGNTTGVRPGSTENQVAGSAMAARIGKGNAEDRAPACKNNSPVPGLLPRRAVAHCFRSHRPLSASQTQSVNRRFRSGKSGSPLTKKPKRWQSSSPGHLPFHACRRASLGSKCRHPSACQPQCGQRSMSHSGRWRSPIGAPQSGQGLSCLLMLPLGGYRCSLRPPPSRTSPAPTLASRR